MIILGIDPAFRVSGFGVIELLHESMQTLIEQFSPASVAIESPFIYKNPQTAIKLGMARGVVMLSAASRALPIAEYSPTQIKSSVVGKGHANKSQVQYMVSQLLGLSEPPSEDAADALACALTHAKIAAFTHKVQR
ncbi:MAG: crossover junction endodeoxyribonuclease RuvC [Thiotrichales bacterium 32-46-8]|nr:MAG: crossover junction endodeoxyribonuclease RuvC [Thiotrichales bacterium 32-46-8]